MKLTATMADYKDALHADSIVRLMDVYANDIMGGGEGLSGEAKSRLVAELSSRSFAFTILVYDGDDQENGNPHNAIALANCFEAFSTFACQPLINIHDVIVLPGYRGIGVSQFLLDAIEEEATRRGCCKLTLEVLEGNTSAQKAYRKFGFGDFGFDPAMGRALFWDKKLGKQKS